MHYWRRHERGTKASDKQGGAEVVKLGTDKVKSISGKKS